MHEVIKIDSDQNTVTYTNLKTKVYNVPIIWKNNICQNTFDQFVLTKSDYSIEVVICFLLKNDILKYLIEFRLRIAIIQCSEYIVICGQTIFTCMDFK